MYPWLSIMRNKKRGGEKPMVDSKCHVDIIVDKSELDDQIEKAKKLISLLSEAADIIRDLSAGLLSLP